MGTFPISTEMGNVPISRPVVSVYVAASLDGYIADEHGGLAWLDEVQRADEDYGHAEFLARVDAIVMGRGTYDACLAFDPWPYPEHDVFVLTHRELDAVPARVSSYAGELAPLLATLAISGKRHVYVDGGQVIAQALAADLVDELTISWIPTLLGRGRPLFHAPLPTTKWQLERVQGYPSGLVQVRYARPA